MIALDLTLGTFQWATNGGGETQIRKRPSRSPTPLTPLGAAVVIIIVNRSYSNGERTGLSSHQGFSRCILIAPTEH